MQIDIPTLAAVAAVTSAVVALALALGLRSDIAANLGTSLRIWTTGIAIQAVGWLLIGVRGVFPDFLAYVVSNVAITLGFAECVRAVRAFGGRTPLRRAYLPVLGVLAASLVFTYVEPSRHWRMLANSAFLAILFALLCREVLRVEPAWLNRPRSHRLVAATFGFGALMLAGRVARLAADGPTPNDAPVAVPMLLVVFYASAAFGPVVASIGFALMCNDRLDSELAFLARIDPLTGVLNRRSLEERARQEISEARRHRHAVSLLLIDLDHFKLVNDTLGHAAGDQALRTVSATLRAQLRDADVLGRIGGEEFVVLLPYTDSPSALLGAERLRAAVEAIPSPVPGASEPLTVSIGVAQWEEGEGLDELLRRADRALYAAKSGGRNRIEPAAPGTAKA